MFETDTNSITADRLALAIRYATEYGQNAGADAGSWAIDGNTDTDACRAILALDEDGDPSLWDNYSSPLSGMYADGDLPNEVLHECAEGFDLTDWESDAILDAYEDAHRDAWRNQVISDATNLI